jgi:hypothetical protein
MDKLRISDLDFSQPVRVPLVIKGISIEFILDTGASSSILSYEVAKQLQLVDDLYLKTAKRFKGTLSNGGRSPLYATRRSLISVQSSGGENVVSFRNFQFLVHFPSKDCPANKSLLGRDLLQLFEMEWSPDRGTLNLILSRQYSVALSKLNKKLSGKVYSEYIQLDEPLSINPSATVLDSSPFGEH